MPFGEYMESCIEELGKRQKYGTALNYRKALNSFSSFLGKRKVPLARFNREVVEDYFRWLSERNISRNSISFYMRILRSVYNKASCELEHETTENPFRNVYTGIDKTRKRALDEDVIRRLNRLDLSRSAALDLSRDLFIFSYCARGMAFIDIAFLRKENIMDEVMRYRRHKTGQELYVRIEPCMLKIIGKYAGKTEGSPYLFPVITETDCEKACRQYRTALAYHNRKLKKIGRLAGVELPLSSYTARHTWATAARNHNIPLSVISAGMGHSSEKTTQIYIASIDNSVIDNANRSIVSLL